MSSGQELRDFITQRLTAAAEEIFSVFEQTVVKFQKEIDRQRILLDGSQKPDPLAAGFSQKHVCEKEEVFSDQQLYSKNNDFPVYQEEPDPSHIKEEPKEMSGNQPGEQSAPKQESNIFKVTISYSDGEELNNDNPAAEIHNWSEDMRDASKLTTNEATESISSISETLYKSVVGTKSIKCDFCGKSFCKMSVMKRHRKIHTGEKSHSCKTCGKYFRDGFTLLRHMRIHTGEKPYACATCGKRFKDNSVLLRHTRIHTGEKPYACKTCGKTFTGSSALLRHSKIHIGEKLHSCSTW